MKTMTTTEAQKSFGDLVNSATRETVAITKHTKEVFVVVPSQEFHRMKKLADIAGSRVGKAKTLQDFIGAGRAHSRFSSVEEVDNFISANREVWKI